MQNKVFHFPSCRLQGGSRELVQNYSAVRQKHASGLLSALRTCYLLAALVIFFSYIHVAPARADNLVGVTIISLNVPKQEREITLTLWYPAQSGGEPILVGDNAVFAGVKGQQNAEVANGRFPLILISHGGLRSAPNLGSWIGSRLASQGFLAAVVDGPRFSADDAERVVAEIWQRPNDISVALTALTGDATWSNRINFHQVAAVGFFLGGNAVISLAGGRLDADAFIQSCDGAGAGLDCDWFAAKGIALGDIDPRTLSQSHLDRRIKVVIAVDPEYTTSFSSESLAGITTPMRVFNLGNDKTILPGLNASALEKVSANITYSVVPEATRFDAFSLCKPQGESILAEDGGDSAICRNSTQEGRGRVHQELTALISGYLKEHFHPLHE